MKKRISVLLLVVTLFLVGCGKGKELKEYDKEKLVSISEEAINLVNEGKYSELIENYFDDSIKDQAKPEDLEQIMKDYIEKVKEFEKFGKNDIIEKEENNVVYAIVAYETIHKEGKLTYTISFNKDYKMIQFLIK